ncbi:MAG: hypothetical protein ABI690_20025 [Chloroflexota bacterium]
MTASSFQPGFRLLVTDERAALPKNSSTFECQPFLQIDAMHPLDRFTANLSREQGAWANALSKEQTAYALAQVSAVNILPSLVELDTGYALLEYSVKLRDHMDGLLLAELVQVLQNEGQNAHWGKVDATVFAAVIGAGVAACIDITSGQETLHLRYANALVTEFSTARRVAELSRSALFLQSALHERFDALLEPIRAHIWFWLIG